MLNNEAKAASSNVLLQPASYANTAAVSASGNWVDVRGYVGDLLVVQNASIIAGATTGCLEMASAAAGTSASSANFTAFTAASASSSNLQTQVISADGNWGWIRYHAILTGAALLSVTVHGRPKVMS